jgi:protein-L-isoaspartate(D-aspartate) O-methyltransferase
MVSFELQRKNMVESQVRPSDVTDRRVLRAMQAIPREVFAPAEVRATAYMDAPLPVAWEAGRPTRYLLSPRVLAKLVQAIESNEDSRVLEIGTATGYGAAVLSHVAAKVVALECDRALADEAGLALSIVHADAVAVVTGPLPVGVPAEGPYDAILVSGAVAEIAPALLDQLKDGGRLVAILADGGVGRAVRWRRSGGTFDPWPLFDADAAVLPGFERKPSFVF